MSPTVCFGFDVLRPQNHSSSQVGAIIPETVSRRLMAGSITSDLNRIIASFQGIWLSLELGGVCDLEVVAVEFSFFVA